MNERNGTLRSTISLEEAADGVWDALVIGAGPAGTMIAREVAQRSARILLVDRAQFPRRKVCGCCFNAAALHILRAVGLGTLPDRLGARPLRTLQLIAGKRSASIRLPDTLALSRDLFDAALVEQAINRGVEWLSPASAMLGAVERSARSVTLAHDGHQAAVRARVVIVASGLSGGIAPPDNRDAVHVEPESRVGLGTVIDSSTNACPSDAIVMICGIGGYVGMVKLPGGGLNVAAALDPAFIRRLRGPAAAVQSLFDETGVSRIGEIETCAWRGTAALSRRRIRISAERLFVICDAAGYVEPFTGEGIAWALASGVAAAPLAMAAAHRWAPALETQWVRLYRRLIEPRQRACWLMAHALRRRGLTRTVVSILSCMPSAAAPLTRRMTTPFRQLPHPTLRVVVE